MFTGFTCHRSVPGSVAACCVLPSSEIQSALAGGIGQGLDAPVIEVAAAVEDHVLDSLGRRALGDQLAHRLGRGDIGAGLELPAQILFERGGRRDRLALLVVDHLRVDVLRRAKHRKPRAVAGGAADVPPDLRRSPQRPISDCGHRALPSLLLAFLAEDGFVGILDALALVRLGLAEGTDLGGDVADLLSVDAGHHDLGRLRHLDRDPFRDRIDDVVAVAELDLQVLALQGGTVADAVDLELALEAFGDPHHHVGEQRAIGAPHRAGALGLDARVDLDLALVDLGLDIAVQYDRQRALGAFHLDRLPFHHGGDAGRDGHGFLSDTRHDVCPGCLSWLSV